MPKLALNGIEINYRDEGQGEALVLVHNLTSVSYTHLNDTDYGLGGGVWTKDLTRAHRFAREMQTGTVWINRYYNFVPGQPLGGFKQSGFGRENCAETLNHYTQTKAVIVNLT